MIMFIHISFVSSIFKFFKVKQILAHFQTASNHVCQYQRQTVLLTKQLRFLINVDISEEKLFYPRCYQIQKSPGFEIIINLEQPIRNNFLSKWLHPGCIPVWFTNRTSSYGRGIPPTYYIYIRKTVYITPKDSN